MKKLIFSFIVVATAILVSCNEEFEEVTFNTSSKFIYTGNCGYGDAVFLTWKTFDYRDVL